MKFGQEFEIEFIGVVVEPFVTVPDPTIKKMRDMALGSHLGTQHATWKGKVLGIPSEFKTVINVLETGIQQIRIYQPSEGPSIFNVGPQPGGRTQLVYVGFKASDDMEWVWRERLRFLPVLQDVESGHVKQIVWDAWDLIGTSICIEF